MTTGTSSGTESRGNAEPFRFGAAEVAPGTTARLDLSAARLPTATPLTIPVRVVHGRRRGPCVWISAALHGDELNGVEIVRRALAALDPMKLRGTVLAVPIVNVFGFIQQSRYLPDGRDLNRSFPGSMRGSLASRMAALFLTEIVAHASHGIDLHTATNHRVNWPQIRADLDDPQTHACAVAFGAPCTLHARTRDGSLRAAASGMGKPVLLYEAGEAQRFDETAIRVGTRGVLQVLAHLGMLGRSKSHQRSRVVARDSTWLRASRGGIARLEVGVGDSVRRGQRVGRIGDAFGEEGKSITAGHDGVVIGRSLNPIVHQGDGLLHVTRGPIEPGP